MRSLAALCSAAFLLGACPSREVADLDPRRECTVTKDVPVSLSRDLDLLFVIDNSGSMGEEQASLARNFPEFMNVLSSMTGGLPNVHIGVVSTDVGIGGYPGVQYCDRSNGKGDDGLLQNAARVPGCTPPSGFFLRDVAPPGCVDDACRERNYEGALADAFACVAQLGTSGCGFEQPLEAMKRALDGHLPQNADFLRPRAHLAVILITDEDDCSARDTSVFDPGQTAVTDPLGPLDSFRCAEFGVRAAGGSQVVGREAATYTDLVPCDGSDRCYLRHPRDDAAFLGGIKPEGHKIFVAGIFGPPAPFAVALNVRGAPEVQPSCGQRDAAACAYPGVRLDAFLDELPEARLTFESICQEDLTGPLAVIAGGIIDFLGDPCLEGNVLADDLRPDEPGLQLDCQVTETIPDGAASALPRCRMLDTTTPDPASAAPCWFVRHDPEKCASYPSQLTIGIAPVGRTVEPGTRIQAQCSVRDGC